MTEVLLSRAARSVTLTLNRPKALNALTLNTVRELDGCVNEIAATAGAACFVMKGAGGKAFCAGGDIKTIYELGKAGNRFGQLDFFREEYQLDFRLAQFNSRVPQVALWDGVVMGGGVGISIHARYRIATEKSVFAMPETAIGFFPDVGGSYVLPRLPAQGMGMYLGLTGARLTGAGLVHAGLANHFVPSADIPALEATLGSCGSQEEVHAAVEAASRAPGASPFSPQDLEDIGTIFKTRELGETVETCADLAQKGSKVATWSSAALAKMSPTSLLVTNEQIRRGAALSLADCYRMEFRLASRMMEQGDFYEGVRSVLIDKDGKPAWRPAKLAEVRRQAVQAVFEPLQPAQELHLPMA